MVMDDYNNNNVGDTFENSKSVPLPSDPMLIDPVPMDHNEQILNSRRLISEEEIKRLTCSLNGFRGDQAHLLTLFVHQSRNLDRSLNHLTDEYQEVSNNSESATVPKTHEFNLRAMEWVYRKIYDLEVPENGLVIFAGVAKSKIRGSSSSRNIVRVMIAFEPEFQLKSSVYKWDTEFHPEILLSNPEMMERRVGIMTICTTMMTVALYSLEEEELMYYEHVYNTPSIMQDDLSAIRNLANSLFLVEDNPIISGIIVGMSESLTQEFRNDFRNPSLLLDDKLLNMVGKLDSISSDGVDGMKELIDASGPFIEETWFKYQKELAETGGSELDEKQDLGELLKEMGLGLMELITEVNGLYTKKVERYFGTNARQL